MYKKEKKKLHKNWDKMCIEKAFREKSNNFLKLKKKKSSIN